MKKTIMGMAVILMMAMSVNAQEREHSMKQGRHKQLRQHGQGMMAKKLNFSEQQKAQVKQINSDYHTNMATLKKQEEITVKEMKAQVNTLQKDHKAALQAVLTPAQKSQLASIKAEKMKMAKVKADARAEKLTIKLGLNEAQSSQLISMRTSMAATMKAIHTDNSLSREQKREQLKTLAATQKEQLKTILTADQLQQMEQMKQQRHRRDFSK